MSVREVPRRRRKVSMPSQEEVRAIRKRIELRKVNLETGSVCLRLDGDEFRLQKVNRGFKDQFCMAWEPRRVSLAELFALRDEAFATFEDAREEALAKTKGTTEVRTEAQSIKASLLPPVPAA
jgi:hypothetical protein